MNTKKTTAAESNNNNESTFECEQNKRLLNKKTSSFRYILSNARSLKPKIESLIDYFDELDLHLAIVTESWLKPGRELERNTRDLESGQRLAILHKSRPTNRNRTAGVSVALIYNKNLIRLNERKVSMG